MATLEVLATDSFDDDDPIAFANTPKSTTVKWSGSGRGRGSSPYPMSPRGSPRVLTLEFLDAEES